MSTATLLSDPTLADEGAWVAVSDQPLPETVEAVEPRAKTRRDEWFEEDPVDVLIAQLIHEGRDDEARRIRLVLNPTTEDDESLILNLISDQLAEDWDSKEDSLYDAL